MKDPTIMAWHRSSRLGEMPPYYDGANPETWWEKYGEGNCGKLEVSVGNEYAFVMMDTQDFETVGQMPLRNLSDESGNPYLCYTPLLARGFETVGDIPLRNLTDRDGNQYLCFTPLQGRDSTEPKQEACTLLDGWLADQY
jgi:hypothetical protein